MTLSSSLAIYVEMKLCLKKSDMAPNREEEQKTA